MASCRAFRLLAVPAAALALSAFAACGLDEHYTGMGTGALPGDKLYPVPDPGPGQCQQTTPDVVTGDLPQIAVADLKGQAWRFDTLTLSKPLPASISDLVNPVIEDQLAQQLINVLVAIDKDDRTAGELNARLGTGPTPADGTTYAFEGTPQQVVFTFENPAFASKADAKLSLSVAMGEDNLVLPIQSLRLKGQVTSDGQSIEAGVLTGAITEEDGALVVIPVFGNLKDFLETQDPPILPDTTVGDKPAWSFEGAFTAVAATVQ